MKRYTVFSFTVVRISLALSLALAAIIGLLTPYVNEDLYLSLAAGRDINKGLLAAPDHWSFIVPNKIWINQAWLSHFLFFKAFDGLGPLGPVAIKAILLAVCVALTLRTCLNVGASLNLALFSTCLGLLASDPFLAIRPENFGLFYLCLLLWLLSGRGSPGRLKSIGIPLTFLLWSNSHGSFMLGLAILALWAFLTVFRRLTGLKLGRESHSSSFEAAGAVMIAVTCFLITAFINPYGTLNLTMPFTQLGTEAVTAHSADWLRLLDGRALTEYVFGATSTYPYFLLLLLLLGSTVAWGLLKLRRSREAVLAPSGQGCDILLQAAIAAALIFMSFRFRRLVLFAGLPLAAALSITLSRCCAVGRRAASERSANIRSALKVAGCLALALGLSFITFRSALPYFPGNPFRAQRAVLRELMSFDSYSPSLITFLKENRVWERVFPGWEISPFLMSHIPEIQVFMDCRDQSFYPPSIIEDYFAILGLSNEPGKEAGSILDQYGVSTIVFTSDEIEFDVAVKLLNSKKWVCLYSDLSSFVLVRADSAQGKRAANNFEGIVFPDESTAVLTRAVYSHFLHGKVDAGLEAGLKRIALTKPRPNLYVYIVSAMGNEPGCLKVEAQRYLSDEAARLSALPTNAPGSGHVLESLESIYGILATNARVCGNKDAETVFLLESQKYGGLFSRLEGLYYGHVFQFR
jgi:hypothetical protein